MGVLLLVALMMTLNPEPARALSDDWFGFVSFEETEEWAEAYAYTCGYRADLFREPRKCTKRDHLQGGRDRELQSPVRFCSKDSLKAEENVTLHIYSYPGMRNAHSVSYGFQRNKECLHGQNTDCFVVPETGRVRALVLNADRSEEGENLNYIKDHFLIEHPERFINIINGGSPNEGKFYEALFLGGYPNDDPAKTSLQIDGKRKSTPWRSTCISSTKPSLP